MMVGADLASAIQSAVYSGLVAQFGSEISGLSAPQQAKIEAEWTKLATAVGQAGVAIVSYIQANAEVEVTGVQSGGSIAMGTVE
jgi:hypothetical protein